MALKHVIKDIKNFFGIGKLRKRIKIDDYRVLLDSETLYSKEPGTSQQQYCDHDIVISLTTYGKRIEIAYLAIASLMRQSRKANRIILWLSEEEFSGKEMPATLTLLEKRGLEIRFCPDIRSYKKLIPTLRLCPNAAIITVDDDVMYDISLIDRLVRAHLAEPNVIWGNRVGKIAFDKKGRIMPYKKWRNAKPLEESDKNFATGVGGVLYPPNVFSDEILDENKFMTLAPTADDLWFKAMALSNDVKVKRILPQNPSGEDDHLGGIVSFSDGLAGENVIGGGNDRSIAALMDYFKKIQP